MVLNNHKAALQQNATGGLPPTAGKENTLGSAPSQGSSTNLAGSGQPIGKRAQLP